jgi:hypothetical protein
MQDLEDFSDDRQKAWCIHCGDGIADIPSNRDHVPTKSLLTKGCRERGANYDRLGEGADDYLPQVLVCKPCNASFSEDENYLLCVLHAVESGSLSPSRTDHPEAANVLRSNRNAVRSLKRMPDGQLFLFDDLLPFTIYPDCSKIERVVVKNARGHAYHELGEPMLEPPDYAGFLPISAMNDDQKRAFEPVRGGLGSWPEVGSRMMTRVIAGTDWNDGWLVVEPNRYRFWVDWSSGVTVRTIIWEYLATETRWDA